MNALSGSPRLNSRNANIDALKGILIILVCVGHAIQFCIYANDGFWNNNLFKLIYVFHMPLFMAVSGFLSYESLERESSKTAYAMRRTASYLVAIFAWSALVQISYMFLGRVHPNEFLGSFFKYSTSLLWFLWALGASLVSISLCFSTDGGFRYLRLIFISCLVYLLPDFGFVYLFQYTFPFFVIGYFVARRSDYFISEPPGILSLFILGILSAFLYLAWTNETYIYVSRMNFSIENVRNIGLRWMAGLIVSWFFVLLVHFGIQISHEKLIRILAYFGRRTLAIYIIQNFFFEALKFPFHNFYLSSHGTPFITAAALAIGLSIASLSLLAENLISKLRLVPIIFLGRIRF